MTTEIMHPAAENLEDFFLCIVYRQNLESEYMNVFLNFDGVCLNFKLFKVQKQDLA